MSTQAHTPGPWSYDEVTTSCGRAYRIGSGEMLSAGKGCCIIYDGYGHGENARKANARLICAAPDLDAAADEAWKALAWIINYDSEDKALARAMKLIEGARKKAGTYDYDAMRARVETEGRAAIAKAEGRS